MSIDPGPVRGPADLPFVVPEHLRAEQLQERMGIELTAWTRDEVVGRMPVAGNRQPYGLLHGGASAVLAETLGSVLAALNVLPERSPVGLELSCTHHRAAVEGWVTGTARPVHMGRSTSTSEIVLVDDQGRRTCTARLDLPAPRRARPRRGVSPARQPGGRRAERAGAASGRPARNTASGRAPPLPPLPSPTRSARCAAVAGQSMSWLSGCTAKPCRPSASHVRSSRRPAPTRSSPGTVVSTSTLPSPRSSCLPAAASSAGRPSRRVTGYARSAAESSRASTRDSASARSVSPSSAVPGVAGVQPQPVAQLARDHRGGEQPPVGHRQVRRELDAGHVHHPRLQAPQYRRGHRTGREPAPGDLPGLQIRPGERGGVHLLRRPEPRGRPGAGDGVHRQARLRRDDQVALDERADAQGEVAARRVRAGQRPGRVRADAHLAPAVAVAVHDQPGLGVVRAGRPARDGLPRAQLLHPRHAERS